MSFVANKNDKYDIGVFIYDGHISNLDMTLCSEKRYWRYDNYGNIIRLEENSNKKKALNTGRR